MTDMLLMLLVLGVTGIALTVDTAVVVGWIGRKWR
jgi:hypothetical protein